jgi:hypothetical protein
MKSLIAAVYPKYSNSEIRVLDGLAPNPVEDRFLNGNRDFALC